MVLGWLLNSTTGTLQLQPHKALRLCQLLQTFQQKTRTSRRKWQSLLGELRYMATALQGARYLFSVLQHVLKDQPTSSRLRLSPLVKQTLSDWASIANDLTSHPMPNAHCLSRPSRASLCGCCRRVRTWVWRFLGSNHIRRITPANSVSRKVPATHTTATSVRQQSVRLPYEQRFRAFRSRPRCGRIAGPCPVIPRLFIHCLRQHTDGSLVSQRIDVVHWSKCVPPAVDCPASACLLTIFEAYFCAG